MNNKNDSSTMRSLERSLDLLECFIAEDRELSLTELSALTNLSISTVHRFVNVLSDRQYLIRNEGNKKYLLGPKIMQLGCYSMSIIQRELRSIAQPFMIKVYEKFKETVGLYVIHDENRLCIDRIQTTQTLRNIVPIGQMVHFSVGGIGKVLLAYMPKDKVKSIIHNYSAEFENMLENIRENKYYVSIGERVEGTTAIGVPILNSLGDIVCVMSISGPSIRISKVSIEEILSYITEVGRNFSQALGYRDEYKVYIPKSNKIDENSFISDTNVNK